MLNRVDRLRLWSFSLGILAWISVAAVAQSPKSKQIVKKISNSKCVFLRGEGRKIYQESVEFDQKSDLARITTVLELEAANGKIEDLATFVAQSEMFRARRKLRELEIAACETAVALSDPIRLREIESVRENHLRRVESRWLGLTGDGGTGLLASIVSQVSVVYELAARSFYNPERARFRDPDIGMHYPGLYTMIQDSSLDQGTKNFFAEFMPLSRYEEAGKLV